MEGCSNLLGRASSSEMWRSFKGGKGEEPWSWAAKEPIWKEVALGEEAGHKDVVPLILLWRRWAGPGRLVFTRWAGGTRCLMTLHSLLPSYTGQELPRKSSRCEARCTHCFRQQVNYPCVPGAMRCLLCLAHLCDPLLIPLSLQPMSHLALWMPGNGGLRQACGSLCPMSPPPALWETRLASIVGRTALLRPNQLCKQALPLLLRAQLLLPVLGGCDVRVSGTPSLWVGLASTPCGRGCLPHEWVWEQAWLLPPPLCLVAVLYQRRTLACHGQVVWPGITAGAGAQVGFFPLPQWQRHLFWHQRRDQISCLSPLAVNHHLALLQGLES